MRARLLLCATAALAGCGGGSPPAGERAAPSATPAGAEVPAGCESAVPTTSVAFPKGLLVPPGARVIAASSAPRPDDQRVTVVEGYIEQPPNQVVATFKENAKLDVLFSEDEGFESEVLVTDGRHRNFWKTVRVCEGASKFTALVAVEKKT